MTDRYHTLTVVLEQGLRPDEAKPLMTAIRQLRGVLSVTGAVSNIDVHVAQERARRELGEKLLAVLSRG